MSEPSAWAQYLENTRRTEELQSEVLRGAKSGEDPAQLLILCSKALSLVTNNPVFADEVERAMMAVQGHALGDPALTRQELEEENKRETPYGMLDESALIHYTFNGVAKQAVWLPLSNGMRLNVTAPLSEINEDWYK